MNKIARASYLKKIASKIELELYAYVYDKAEKVASEITDFIERSQLDKGGFVFITGPQNSGKSIVGFFLNEKLNQKVRGESHRSMIAVQPDVERSDIIANKFFSRSGVSCPAYGFSTKEHIEEIFHKYSIVVLDEVQFIPYELQGYFLKEAMDFKKRGGWLVSMGLLYTSLQTEFLLSSILYERSDYKYNLMATCQMCGRKNATKNQRLVDGKPARIYAPELVPPNGKVSYEPRCNDCLVE